MSLERRILRRKVATRDQIRYAREQADVWSIGLAEALVTYAGVDPVHVAEAEADELGMDCLAGRPNEILNLLDVGMLRAVGRHAALRLGALPLRRRRRKLEFITVRPDNRAARSFFAEELGYEAFREALVTWADVIACLQYVFRDELAADALNRGRKPEQTAERTASPAQLASATLGVLALVTFGALWPLGTLRIAGSVLIVAYVSVFVFRFLLAGMGSMEDVLVDVSDEELAAMKDQNLPVYTVLLPMYRESASLPQLVRGIKALDYPIHKLDVIVLLEEGDDEMTEALARYPIPASWTILRVPAGVPRTKPRACNYGMLFARGQYLVTYDAEDLPEHDQLRKAVRAFLNASGNTICLQCLLTYYNRSRTLLSRLFTLEHWYWFDAVVPGLISLDMPIPMSGSSNHFHIGKLRALGGWDPYNLTEDVDLSTRISMENQQVAVLRSTTREEANPQLWNWIRQRSRWFKGYMQTFLVHTRNPFTAVRDLGLKASLSLLFFVGGTPFVFLLAPFLLVVILLAFFVAPYAMQTLFTPLLVAIITSGVAFAGFLGAYMHMYTAFRRRVDALVGVALLTPIYWLLHSFSAFRALGQLVREPHVWEKTEHLLFEDPTEDIRSREQAHL
ncbi:MAG: glycosyltransferase family 2 protein [Spirochaetales bacterium]